MGVYKIKNKIIFIKLFVLISFSAFGQLTVVVRRSWACSMECPLGKKMVVGRLPCREATPETAIRKFVGWPARGA
jgi:hypothetical protein